MTLIRLALAIVAFVVLSMHRPAAAQDRGQAELREIIERLEMGMTAVDALGRHELYRELDALARELRGKLQPVRRDGREPLTLAQAEGRLELLRLAFEVVRATDHGRVADRLEHAVHAYELVLAGRDDPEAERIVDEAPRRPEQVELLGFAARVAEERGQRDHMRRILLGRDELWPGWNEREDAEPMRDAAVERERQLGHERLEMLHTALPVLREMERMDAVELIERAIRAMEVNLEGREDPRAQAIRRAAPAIPQQVELLMLASELWDDVGHETKAARLREYANELRDAQRERPRRREADARPETRPESDRAQRRPRETERTDDGVRRRLDALEDRLGEIERLLREVVGERGR